MLLVAGLVGGALFGAGAPPAFGADLEESLAPPVMEAGEILERMPELPEIDSLEVAVPPLEAATEDAEPDSPDGSEIIAPTVVSPELEPDITTTATQTGEIDRAGGSDMPETPHGPGSIGLGEVADALSAPGVTSPEQREAIVDELEAIPSADTVDRRLEASEPREPRVQYQEGDSRYQSDAVSNIDSWTWSWYLELDCSGIVSSISSEVGNSASGNWTWIWTWKWSCGLDGASESARDALRDDPSGSTIVSTQVSTPAPEDEQTGAGALWTWTWTFTFCGHVTTISMSTTTATSLNWVWNWTWEWACTAAPSGEDGQGAPEDPSGNPDPPEALPWIDQLMGGEGAIHAAGGSVLRHGPPPPIAAPLLSSPIRTQAAVPRVVSTPRPSARAPGAEWPSQTAAAPSLQRPARTATVSASSPTRTRPSEPRRTRTPRLPLDAPTRTAGSPSPSGSASSGGGGNVAALTSFVTLAAPGLGRPIRETRELSPRAPVRARLERPG